MIELEEAKTKARRAEVLIAAAENEDGDESRRTAFLRSARIKLREADRELKRIVKLRGENRK